MSRLLVEVRRGCSHDICWSRRRARSVVASLSAVRSRSSVSRISVLCGAATVSASACRSAARSTSRAASSTESVAARRRQRGARAASASARRSALTVWRRTQAEERLLLGADYADLDLVFARPDGRPTHPEVISRTFERLVARSSLTRIRFHDVRHTRLAAVSRPACQLRSLVSASVMPPRASPSTSTGGCCPACKPTPLQCSRV